jgi:hypothetical protein
MSKLLCIYHGGCDDGFGAAYAVWKALGEGVEFHAGVYQNPPPDVTGRAVAIVDFSYKRPIMLDIIDKAHSVLVLDHHKTAEADLAGLDGPKASVIFDMNRSGAAMAWNHFHPNHATPGLIAYIQDRDLWTKRLPGVDEFTAALRSYPQDFRVWDGLSVSQLITEGGAIQRYYRTLVESAKSHAYRRDIGGYNVPVVNASLFMASELAGELAAGEPFAAVYAETETHVIWSLRSRAPDGVDVSEIAKAHGGGGHKHAAGFKVAS